MRWLQCSLLLTMVLVAPEAGAAARPARILKVLEHRLDQAGRHALSPSLYERDAYQAYLRRNPSECSGLQFDVQWKAKGRAREELKLRLELLPSRGEKGKAHVVEQSVTGRRWWSRWTKLTLAGDKFRELGEPVGWRVTLWNGDQLLAEQQSFLW